MSSVPTTGIEKVIVISMWMPMEMGTWIMAKKETYFYGNCNINRNGKSDCNSDNETKGESDGDINVNSDWNDNMNNVGISSKL